MIRSYHVYQYHKYQLIIVQSTLCYCQGITARIRLPLWLAQMLAHMTYHVAATADGNITTIKGPLGSGNDVLTQS